MTVSSTTKMVNLLTLGLVLLPGLSLSFSNMQYPWREPYERVQESGKSSPLGRYVCCNNPATIPPYPRPRHGLFLTLAKRDDRDSPFRKAAMGPWITAAGAVGEAGGRYPGGDAARSKDPLLVGILNMLRSSVQHRPSRYGGATGSRPGDLEDSAYLGKRDHEDGHVVIGKKAYGEIGGANMDWED